MINSSKRLRTTTAVLMAATGLLSGTRAAAQPVGPDPTQAIGVNFLAADVNGFGINDQPDSLLPAETAGAFPQQNWNNCGRYGGGLFSLTNHAGSPVTLTLNWDSVDTDTTGSGGGLGTPDGKLMDGFLFTWGPGSATPLASSVYASTVNNKPLVYIGGLQSWYTGIPGAEGYAVALYTKGYSYWQVNEGWVQSVTGDPLSSTMVEGADLTPRLYKRDNEAFLGTFNRITSTDSNNPTAGGNYMYFSGLTNDSVLLRVQSPPPNYTSSLNGFQLIPVYATPPTASAPTFNPSDTVYAGETVTLTEAAANCPFHPELWYQWQSDGGTGGAMTDLLNATNATFTLAPTNHVTPYSINFQVIVTNIHGASTSSIVTLNVNPAVPPYITQDTTPGVGNSAAGAYAYVGGSITFNAAFGGPTPITYAWQSNSVNIAGATSTSLTLTNLQMSSAASYQLVAENQFGSTPSTPTALTILDKPSAPTSAVPYPYCVFTNNPAAYWRLSETLDNVNYSVQAYDYSGNDLNGTFGNGVSGNQLGPISPNFAGLEADNLAAYFIKNVNNSSVVVPPLNLNTNTVTITAWINPSMGQTADTGLFIWSNGGTKAGLRFGSNTSGGMAELGYLWNSSSGSSGFHSGLYPPAGLWSFVALTITPTNSTVYLYYADAGLAVTNLLKASHTITNAPAAFSGGTTWIGSDTTASRNFDGLIDEIAVFDRALNEAQVQDLFLKALGAAGVPPSITLEPTNSIGPMFAGQDIKITAAAGGAPSPNYQWQWSQPGAGVFSDLANGGGVTGANSETLSLSGNALAVSLDYRMLAVNPYGSATSSVCAVLLTPVPTNGLWTSRYQVTNSSGYLGWTDGYGSGSFTGRGILGTGSYWNPVPGTGQWGWGPSFTSISTLRDDAATPSGVLCTFNGGLSISAAATTYPSNDRRGLHSQFLYHFATATNAIVLSGVPNGNYNVALHGKNSPWNDRGTTFVVHGANGDQTAATINTTQFQYFVDGDTAVVFTNVQVTGGILNIDLTPTPSVPTHPVNNEAAVNAVEIQLVSYAAPTAGFSASATNVFVGQAVTFLDASSPVTNSIWNFGDGNVIETNANGNLTHSYAAAGTYTVSQTVKGPGGTASVTRTDYISVWPRLSIGSPYLSAGNLVLGGVNGIPGAQFRILASTNLALPLANWTPVWTNQFGVDGSYSYTNASSTNGASFFILVSP